MTDQKVVLTTGASSGIGRATAELLTSRGYRVFGTARDPEAVVPLQGVELLPLDVRDDASVASGVEAVLGQTGRIDVLVNNAGYSVVGAIEETSPSEAQALFDTNVFGVLRMMRAVLPAMRRQGSGTIVNTSSVLGFLPAPFMGLRQQQTCRRGLVGVARSRGARLRHPYRAGRAGLHEDAVRRQRDPCPPDDRGLCRHVAAGLGRDHHQDPSRCRPGDRRRGNPARDRAAPPDASAGRLRGAAPEQAAPLHAGRTGRSERP
jgi:short chain dehydrogenase